MYRAKTYRHFDKFISQQHFLFSSSCHMSEFCVGVRGALPYGGIHISTL